MSALDERQQHRILPHAIANPPSLSQAQAQAQAHIMCHTPYLCGSAGKRPAALSTGDEPTSSTLRGAKRVRWADALPEESVGPQQQTEEEEYMSCDERLSAAEDVDMEELTHISDMEGEQTLCQLRHLRDRQPCLDGS